MANTTFIASLLSSLSQHLEINSVIIFQQENDLNLLPYLFNNYPNMKLSAPSEYDFEFCLLENNEDNVLIFSDDTNVMKNAFKSMHYLKVIGHHVTWMFPKTVDLNDLPLRLDSNIMTFEEMDGKITLQENYKVKGGPLITIDFGELAGEELTIFEPSKWNR